MISMLIYTLLLATLIFLLAEFLPRVRVGSYLTAIIVAVVYSIANTVIGSILLLLTLPLVWLTFGLFTLVINATMLWLTDKLIDDFKIDGLLTTLVMAVLITIGSSVIKGLMWVFVLPF